MAVTFFNATATAGIASAAARTVTIVGTSEATLLVWAYADSGVSLSAMACGTLPMTRLGLVSAGGCIGELWGLSSVPTGTLTISAIPVGVATTKWCMAAATYIGQRTVGGSPFGTVVLGTATAANAAFSVSSTTADLVAFGFGLSANSAFTISNNTRASATASTGVRLVIGDVAGAAVVSVSATAVSSGVWGFMGVPIVASATPTTTIVFDNAAASAGDTISSFGVRLTATTGAVLLVFISGIQIATGATVSAVNVGATQLGFLGAVGFNAVDRVELWGLTAPPSGVLTISAALVGTGRTQWNMAAVTYTGHKTTANPFGGIGISSAGVVLTTTVSVSSTAGNVVVIGFSNRTSPPSISVGAAFTIRAAPLTLNPAIMLVDTIGGPSITGSAQAGSAAAWGTIGINLIQSGTASFISGAAAMTDGAGTFSSSANVRVSGSFIKTDTADTFSASSGVRVRATFAATDTPDTFSASGGVRVRGTFATTDAPDSFSASGGARVRGSFIKTDAPDTFVATGAIMVTGLLAATDIKDTFVGTAGVRVTGTLAASDVADVFTAVGITTNNRIGSLVATDAPDTFSASGVARIVGSLAATGAADAFSASGQVKVIGLLAATDTRDTFSASANVIPAFITGSISATDAPDTFLARTPLTLTPANLSYGGSGGKKGKTKPPYIQIDSDWWDARERYLRALQPELEEPVVESSQPAETYISPATVSPQFLIDYRAERRAVIQAIPLAENMKVLRVAGERLRTINQKIIEQERAQAAELSFKRAEAALVQADTAERRALRQQQIKRKRIAIATLEVARQVVRLYGNHHL